MKTLLGLCCVAAMLLLASSVALPVRADDVAAAPKPAADQAKIKDLISQGTPTTSVITTAPSPLPNRSSRSIPRTPADFNSSRCASRPSPIAPV